MKLIPTWVWLAIIGVMFLANSATFVFWEREKSAHSKSKAEYSDRVAKAEKSARDQSEKYRAIEQELSHVQSKAEREAQALHAALDTARDSGRLASTRLRDAAAAAATASRADCQATASAELRETAARASRLLADVHNELDRRAGVYAEEADRRGIAGRACETIYENAVKLTN